MLGRVRERERNRDDREIMSRQNKGERDNDRRQRDDQTVMRTRGRNRDERER